MKKKTTKFKSLDFFGLGISFKVEGNAKSASDFGAVVSILCAALIIAYSLYQLQILWRYQGTAISYILNKNVFEDTD
jgi:hypothetical protein